jgi:hypothetical protein
LRVGSRGRALGATLDRPSNRLDVVVRLNSSLGLAAERSSEAPAIFRSRGGAVARFKRSDVNFRGLYSGNGDAMDVDRIGPVWGTGRTP